MLFWKRCLSIMLISCFFSPVGTASGAQTPDWEKALAQARASHNQPRVALLLLKIANARLASHDVPGGILSLREKQNVDHDLGRHNDETRDLYEIGVFSLSLGHGNEALQAYEDALALEQAETPLMAETLEGLGRSYNFLDRRDEALQAYRRASTINRKLHYPVALIGDLSAIAQADTIMATEGATSRVSEDALNACQEVLSLQPSLKPSEKASASSSITTCDEILGRFDDALHILREQEAAAHLQGNTRSEAITLSFIGILYYQWGRLQEALTTYQKAQILYERVAPLSVMAINNFHSIGETYHALGRYEEALSIFQNAKIMQHAIHNLVGEESAVQAIAYTNSALNREEEALNAHQELLAMYHATNDRWAQAATLWSIGADLGALNRERDALQADENARRAYRDLHSPRGEAKSLLGMVGPLITLHDVPEAKRVSQEALDLGRSSNDASIKSSALSFLGTIENLLHHTRKATQAFQEFLALPIEDPIGNVHPELFLAEKAIALAQLGRREEALAAFKEAMEDIEHLRTEIPNETDRSFIASKSSWIYDYYLDFLHTLHQRYPTYGYDRMAFAVFEREAARRTLEEIGHSRASQFHDVPPAIIDAEKNGELQLEAAYKLKNTGIAIDQHLQHLSDTQRELEERIRRLYPNYYKLRYPQPIELNELQHHVLAPGEVLLMYRAVPHAVLLFVISRNDFAFLSLPSNKTHNANQIQALLSARLQKHLTRVQDALATTITESSNANDAATRDLPGYAQDAYALYRQLIPNTIEPLIAQAKSLIIVPASELSSVPWEALVTRKPRGGAAPHYLIEDHPISYLPSASLLGIIRSTTHQASPASRPFLAFAEPSSNNGPELPGALEEARTVQATLQAPSESVVSGHDATTQRLIALNQSGELRRYRYLLFATHAILPQQDGGPISPQLLLADSPLTMEDIFNLSLNADFVSLSACDTGAGTFTESDGINGLTRAFFYAGTPALSITLRPLLDNAASIMDPVFFQSMREGLAPAQALQRAKIDMIKAPQAWQRHPLAWSPTVVFGDADRLAPGITLK